MRTPRAGFTLIELLITVVLLSVGILAMIGSITTTNRFQTLNLMTAEMSDMAYSKLDELRAINLATSGDSIVVGPGPNGNAARVGSINPGENVSGYNDLVPGASGRQYRRQWLVETTGSDIPIGTRRLTIRVTTVGFTWASYEVRTLLYVAPKTL